jgi:hypothetical protein
MADSCVMVMDGFINRYVTVTPNISLPSVCWESCAACDAVSVSDELVTTVFSVYPNPSNELISFSFGLDAGTIIVIRDLAGKAIHHEKLAQWSTSLSVNHLTAGVYSLEVVNQKGFSELVRFVKR